MFSLESFSLWAEISITTTMGYASTRRMSLRNKPTLCRRRCLWPFVCLFKVQNFLTQYRYYVTKYLLISIATVRFSGKFGNFCFTFLDSGLSVFIARMRHCSSGVLKALYSCVEGHGLVFVVQNVNLQFMSRNFICGSRWFESCVPSVAYYREQWSMLLSP